MLSKIKNKILYWKYKYFTGRFSVFTNRIPLYEEVERILMIVSSNWEIANKIEEWVVKNFPNAQVTYLLRDDYPDVYSEKDIVISSRIVTIFSKIKTILELRKKQIDVVVVCWSGEPGYAALKILGLLLKSKSILVFNINGDCFWVIKSNLKTIIKHLLWRIPKAHGGLRIKIFLIKYLTLIILLPAGLIFVLIRVIYYTMKKKYLTLLSKMKAEKSYDY